MANGHHKVRRRFLDPLSGVLSCVSADNVGELKAQLSDAKLKEIFQGRLVASKAEKDQSPLIISILKGAENCFQYILGNYPRQPGTGDIGRDRGRVPPSPARPPLWTASTLGKLSFVKELVGRGADIDHTTQSKSSPPQGGRLRRPLRGVQVPHRPRGGYRQAEPGANVQHRGHNGDTPLHVCVESGSVEIATILVNAGAKNCANDVGFTPAILACCYGHAKVLRLLGGHLRFGAHGTLQLLLSFGRQGRPKFKLQYRGEVVAQGGCRPPETQEIFRRFPQSAQDVKCTRRPPSTIRICGDMALAEKDYGKSLELWQRSLEFDEAARMAYELQIIEDLLFCVRGFSIMADNGFTPSIEQHFNWGLREYRLAHDSKISENDVIFCLARMLATWIKVADRIKDRKQREVEDDLIHRAGVQLVEISRDNPCPLLIACLQNLPTESMGAAKEIACNKLPLQRVLALLLEMGCPVQCEDGEGNFPLHLAARLQEDNALHCVRTLIEYGAHVDAVNHEGKTALDLPSG
eukprot:Em0793g2a